MHDTWVLQHLLCKQKLVLSNKSGGNLIYPHFFVKILYNKFIVFLSIKSY